MTDGVLEVAECSQGWMLALDLNLDEKKSLNSATPLLRHDKLDMNDD